MSLTKQLTEVEILGKIWAKQLILGTKKWSDVPVPRRTEVKTALQEMVDEGKITEEQYNSIIGNTVDIG